MLVGNTPFSSHIHHIQHMRHITYAVHQAVVFLSPLRFSSSCPYFLISLHSVLTFPLLRHVLIAPVSSPACLAHGVMNVNHVALG